MPLPSLLSFLALLLAINGARAKPDTSESSPLLPQAHSSSSFSPSSSSVSVSVSSSLFSSSPSLSVTSSNTLSASASSHATTSSSSERSLSSATTTTTTTSYSYSSSTALSSPFSYATSSSVPPSVVVASATLVVTTSDTASVVVVTMPTASTLSSSGFWSNKRAVAATFSIVALCLCGLIGGAIFALARQRKRDREITAAEEFLDKHNSMGMDAMPGPSPSPSMLRETTHAPAEAYMSRDVHFGSEYMHYGGQETYGLDYPPGTTVNQDNGQPIHFNYSSDNQGHSSAYVPPHPPATVGNMPPVSYRQPRGRESGTYQPSSIDSFYGGIEDK